MHSMQKGVLKIGGRKYAVNLKCYDFFCLLPIPDGVQGVVPTSKVNKKEQIGELPMCSFFVILGFGIKAQNGELVLEEV